MPLPSRPAPAPVRRDDPPYANVAMKLVMGLLCAVVLLAITGVAWLVAAIVTHFPH